MNGMKRHRGERQERVEIVWPASSRENESKDQKQIITG